MTQRRPLVTNEGFLDILPIDDTVAVGDSPTEIIAGSGLSGGGSVSTEPRLDFAIAPNPSGLIYVEDAIGNDGVALSNSQTAISNITDAIGVATNALASGNSALELGTAALASGNAALELVPDLSGAGGNTTVLRAGGAINKGSAVGINDAQEVEEVGLAPALNSSFNVFTSFNYTQNNSNGLDIIGQATTCVPLTDNYVAFFGRDTNGYLMYSTIKFQNNSWDQTTFSGWTTLQSVNINNIAAVFDGEAIHLTVNIFSGNTGTFYKLIALQTNPQII